MNFSEFNLHEDLLKGIEKTGFAQCMEVQEATLEHTLRKRDAYVQSQTGSGKTAAFLITIFELFIRGEVPRKRSLVIVPTRELAVQIEREAKEIGSFLPYRIGSVYGGVGYDEQLSMLKEGYEIIIGTPGRLIDLAQSKKLILSDISILVIDEADRLFDMGFLPDIRKMLKSMNPERMTMLFSATLNTRVWQVSWEYMNDPVEIMMNPEQLTVDEITQELYHVSRDEKVNLLLGILKKEKPENALIFCNTKSGVYDLSERLNRNGYRSQYIIGDLPQKKRIRVIDQLKSGELSYLVATDVAARGLHVDDLALVVNYDLPEDPENYVHRIGRTARAGNTGKAISLACERFVYGLEPIEKLIDMKIPVMPVTDELIVTDASAGMYFNRHRDSDERERRPRGRSSGRSSSRSGSRQPRSSGTGGRSSKAPGIRGGRPEAAGTRGLSAKEPAAGGRPPEAAVIGSPSPKAPVSSGESSNRSRRRPTKDRHPGATGTSAKAEAHQPGEDSTAAHKRPAARLQRDMDISDRLEYYRQKYGEDFALKDESASGQDTRQEKTADQRSATKKKRNLKSLFRRKR
ncbi:MAG: DEAD/DEAH box helicase [Spirochaetales bacterium]|nr:DEAD/DEAH box helicase [Spirochaetales bacterium]